MEHISEEHFLFPQAPPTHPKHIQLIQGIFHTSPLTSRKFSRYNIHRDSISDAVFCGYGGIGRRARFRCCHLSEGFYRPIIRRALSLVKAGSSCFYRCGSSVMLRLGSSPCKNQRRIKQRQVTLPLISAGMMELVDMRDLGSRAVMRWGSSPHARTICARLFVWRFLFT